MAGSLNKVQLIGTLGRDPEARAVGTGRVVNLRVATSETWRDKSTGEKKERTEWHSVTIWNEHVGKVAEDYLRKGSKVFIEGALETRKWQDQSGQDRYATEVVLRPFGGQLILLGDPRGGRDQDDDGGADRSPRNDGGRADSRARPGSQSSGPYDDEIPF